MDPLVLSPRVSVGALMAMHTAFVLSHEDLETVRGAAQRYEVLRPTPPAR